MSLVDFLRAMFDADEAAALAAQCPAVYAHFGDTAAEALLGLARSEGAQDEAVQHFLRHDPTHVLAEVGAKRAVLALFDGLADESFCNEWDAAGWRVLRHLAAPYASHAEYRAEEWSA